MNWRHQRLSCRHRAGRSSWNFQRHSRPSSPSLLDMAAQAASMGNNSNKLISDLFPSLAHNHWSSYIAMQSWCWFVWTACTSAFCWWRYSFRPLRHAVACYLYSSYDYEIFILPRRQQHRHTYNINRNKPNEQTEKTEIKSWNFLTFPDFFQVSGHPMVLKRPKSIWRQIAFFLSSLNPFH